MCALKARDRDLHVWQSALLVVGVVSLHAAQGAEEVLTPTRAGGQVPHLQHADVQIHKVAVADLLRVHVRHAVLLFILLAIHTAAHPALLLWGWHSRLLCLFSVLKEARRTGPMPVMSLAALEKCWQAQPVLRHVNLDRLQARQQLHLLCQQPLQELHLLQQQALPGKLPFQCKLYVTSHRLLALSPQQRQPKGLIQREGAHLV
mmetsp:Transcript_22296/g.61634  ORF Transcript_22296/g.61634 Transcript_22296/m.61634 type:complete len:204 (+) Transcript_22296:806-1417(+)